MINKMVVLSDELSVSIASWLGSVDHLGNHSKIEQARKVIEDFRVGQTAHTLLNWANGPQLNVALQFPDSLLPQAPCVCEALSLTTNQIQLDIGSSIDILYFILGDTSYGECCVDEVASEHLNADIVVHYGNACLSPTRHLPVIYVFPALTFEDPHVVTKRLLGSIENISQEDGVDRIVVLYDTELSPCFQNDGFLANNVEAPLCRGISCEVSVASLRFAHEGIIIDPSTNGGAKSEGNIVGSLRYGDSSISFSRTAFLWVTLEPSHDDWPAAARNAALQLSSGFQELCAGFYGISLKCSSADEPKQVNASRMLRKRFALLSKAQDADRIGIVPGTLGVSGNLAVIERCKRIIKSAEKRYYMTLVGKPNPSKLANFPEIDIFVLVACPQNSIIDGSDYLRPIITPLELEAALLWDGDLFRVPYSVDFLHLLENDLNITEEVTDQEENIKSAVASRGDWTVSVTGAGSAADFLNARHWKGLKYDSGGLEDDTHIDDLPTHIIKGQVGLASRYERESAHADTSGSS